MANELNNELALVTGASRGIGHAIALALGAAGARVVGTATSAEGAAALTEAFKAKGIQGRGAVLDASKAESVEALLAELEGAEGLPSILGEQRRDYPGQSASAHEAGRLGRGPCHQSHVSVPAFEGLREGHDEEPSRSHRDDYLHRRRHGQPGAGELLRGEGGRAGLHQVAREGSRLAQHHGQRRGAGVHRHRHDPGPERRPALGPAIARFRSVASGAAEDIAQAVLFLASPLRSYITGETLHVNGGMYMP